MMIGQLQLPLHTPRLILLSQALPIDIRLHPLVVLPGRFLTPEITKQPPRMMDGRCPSVTPNDHLMGCWCCRWTDCRRLGLCVERLSCIAIVALGCTRPSRARAIVLILIRIWRRRIWISRMSFRLYILLGNLFLVLGLFAFVRSTYLVCLYTITYWIQ